MVEELRAKYIFLQLFFRYTDNETFFLSPFTWSFLMYIFKIFSQLKNSVQFLYTEASARWTCFHEINNALAKPLLTM